ncbi:MAG TPA: sensor histidine kinase [Gemmatimonadales bacterium]
MTAEPSRPDLPRLERAPRRLQARGRAAPSLPGWMRRLLAVPLGWKLLGKDVLVGILTAAAVVAVYDAGLSTGKTISALVAVVAAAVCISLLLSAALSFVALRPVEEVENTAERVWRGDFGARVPPSLLADRDMARVGNTFNLLLDSIERDRGRMRRLAGQIIAAQDEERARLARELHDSVAQTLAALVLQLSALRRDSSDPALDGQLELVHSIASEALEEVRLLSHTVYPRVLEDLGLVAALEWLARQTREAERFSIEVVADCKPAQVPKAQGAALYRVAQEAVRNASRHADPEHVTLSLYCEDGWLTLEVADDGRGFDVARAEERRPGMGLFAIRDRVALADGRVEIDSTPGRGTMIRAAVPLEDGDRPA